MADEDGPWRVRARKALDSFQYTGRALRLVRETSPSLLGVLVALTLLAGLLPGGIVWVGKHIVDAVVAGLGTPGDAAAGEVLRWVALEGGLVLALAAVQRGLFIAEQLLRAQLGQKVNALILAKALTLTLRSFEDAEFYDKMTRARREPRGCCARFPARGACRRMTKMARWRRWRRFSDVCDSAKRMSRRTERGCGAGRARPRRVGWQRFWTPLRVTHSPRE